MLSIVDHPMSQGYNGSSPPPTVSSSSYNTANARVAEGGIVSPHDGRFRRWFQYQVQHGEGLDVCIYNFASKVFMTH